MSEVTVLSAVRSSCLALGTSPGFAHAYNQYRGKPTTYSRHPERAVNHRRPVDEHRPRPEESRARRSRTSAIFNIQVITQTTLDVPNPTKTHKKCRYASQFYRCRTARACPSSGGRRIPFLLRLSPHPSPRSTSSRAADHHLMTRNHQTLISTDGSCPATLHKPVVDFCSR